MLERQLNIKRLKLTKYVDYKLENTAHVRFVWTKRVWVVNVMFDKVQACNDHVLMQRIVYANTTGETKIILNRHILIYIFFFSQHGLKSLLHVYIY